MHSNAYVTSVQKRTYGDHWNMPNHHMSTYMGCGILQMYGCEGVWVKVTVLNAWLADLYAPNGVDLGRVAPPHIGVTQYSKTA